MNEFEKIAKVSEIKPGEGQSYTLGDKIVGVFNVDGEFFAINDLCPHMGASLSAGHVEGCTVTCPWHAWRFSVDDGTWCDNRRLKIDTYEVKIIDDEVWVSKTPTEVDPDKPAATDSDSQKQNLAAPKESSPTDSDESHDE